MKELTLTAESLAGPIRLALSWGHRRGGKMPRFIIERNTGQLTRQELDAAARRSNAVLAEMDGVSWIRSYVSHADGKIFCEYEAPNADLIREHARRAGLPADAVREIQLTINPDMFR
ncbi:MAG: DUF4242 domain-containing protein [Vicinamibacterales bacterium]